MLKSVFTPFLAAGLIGAAFCTISSEALAVVAPIALPPGTTVSSLPNGFSSYPGDEGVTLLDDYVNFDFGDGALSGVLRERVLQYSQVNEYHPYGGLYFDYEITLYSGDVIEFSALGYTGLEVAVKQCGVSGCGGSGAQRGINNGRCSIVRRKLDFVLFRQWRSCGRHSQRESPASDKCNLVHRSARHS